jgi:hypothetical protein
MKEREVGSGYWITKTRKNTLNKICEFCRGDIVPGQYVVSKTVYAYRSCITERWHILCFKKALSQMSRRLTTKRMDKYLKDNMVLEI